jgi:DinB superfamily
MTITPDTKDWTWVLHRRCPECGLQVADIPPGSVAAMIRENAAEWVEILAGPDVARRPAPEKWSPLEYACHVRDALRIYHRRLRLMLSEDDPLYPNWDQDATAVEERYAEQDPAVVAGELREAAAALADAFDGVSDAQWQRTGNRSDGARFTVESFARYFVHDPLHHLYDVTGRPAAR